MTRPRLLVVGCALALTACTGGASALADCADVERPPLQEGSHLLGGQAPPVPYSSDPPSSGWHASGRPLDPGTYPEPVSAPDQVLVLELGGVVVSYDPALPEDVVGDLQRLPESVDDVVVTPWPGATDPVALTAWGVVQRCEAVTAADVEAFREQHARDEGH